VRPVAGVDVVAAEVRDSKYPLRSLPPMHSGSSIDRLLVAERRPLP
jgi:hypothetical protein